MNMSNISASPCTNPWMTLDEVLPLYAAMGYRKFEAFTSWTKSALDYRADPAPYVEKARRAGMTYSSMHLPPVGEDLNVGEAVAAARFAAAIGACAVLFKAKTRPIYVKSARAFLDAVRGLPITPVLQNHAGTAISSLEDFREVIDGINDPRMKTLFEVGHFHKAGVKWRDGYKLLAGSIALVHIKDMIGGDSVAFGAGEIDLPALFAHMRSAGYEGDFVVEVESEPKEARLQQLFDAYGYIRDKCMELERK